MFTTRVVQQCEAISATAELLFSFCTDRQTYIHTHSHRYEETPLNKLGEQKSTRSRHVQTSRLKVKVKGHQNVIAFREHIPSYINFSSVLWKYLRIKRLEELSRSKVKVKYHQTLITS